MNQTADMSTTIFEAALTAGRPVRVLMEMAKQSVNQGEQDNLHNIDTMLTGVIVDYIRRGYVRPPGQVCRRHACLSGQ